MTDNVLKPVRQNLLDANEWSDIKNDITLHEMENMQGRISQLEDTVLELMRDIERLQR